MEAVAKLRNYPSSPRKMRLIADAIRGMEVNKALKVLKFTRKHAARPLERLLVSAVSNWENKNGGVSADEPLVIKSITVDGGRILKRMQPAPMGRAYRIRKRSNHVTVIVDAIGGDGNDQLSEVVEEIIEENDTQS